MAKQKGIPKQWQEKICPRCGIALTKDNHRPKGIKRSVYMCKGCYNDRLQKNREEINKRSRINYQKNKEKINKRRKIYHLKNKEKIKEKRRIYYQKNREKIKERVHKYRAENLKEIVESQRKYRLKNKEKIVARRRRHRTKALEILGGKCVYCGCDTYEALEINHINGRGTNGLVGRSLTRRILDGNVNLSELEITCRICNAWHYLTKLRRIQNGWTISWKQT